METDLRDPKAFGGRTDKTCGTSEVCVLLIWLAVTLACCVEAGVRVGSLLYRQVYVIPGKGRCQKIVRRDDKWQKCTVHAICRPNSNTKKYLGWPELGASHWLIAIGFKTFSQGTTSLNRNG